MPSEHGHPRPTSWTQVPRRDSTSTGEAQPLQHTRQSPEVRGGGRYARYHNHRLSTCKYSTLPRCPKPRSCLLRTLISRLTGWALAERLFVAFGAVLLGLHRHGHLRLTRQGLVYDESLRLLGRSVSQRTVAIPLSAVAARLDRRHGVASLLVGLASAMGATFLSVLWTLDGLRSGYWPFFLAAAGVFLVGLVVDLLIFRISGRLRGRSQLVLDGGEGARIRLDGVRRAEAEAMLAALAGPSRSEAFDERPPS